MQANPTVTQNEYVVREGALIVSVTDAEGRIVTVSPEFIQVSGYSAEELIGNNHGILRHPDMPSRRCTRTCGRRCTRVVPGRGLMKNRRKNGDYFWDIANATPLREGGAISGYMTIRTKPSAHQIREAEELYAKFATGSDKSLTLIAKAARVRNHWSDRAQSAAQRHRPGPALAGYWLPASRCCWSRAAVAAARSCPAARRCAPWSPGCWPCAACCG